MLSDAGLIDSHCHLNYDYAPKTEDDLVREAREAGVTALITIGTDKESIARVASISEKFDCVYHTVGVHPHDAQSMTGELDIDLLRQAARHPKCRAIGEIGLDYHYDNSPRETQRLWMDQQLELALELGLPVVIHSRDAEDDLLASLERYARRVPAGAPVGVIHCFSGTRAFGEACLKLGFLISFSGIVTFKSAETLRECARDFPLDRILVETDSPFLAPVPFRGKKCEPSMVKMTALKIAELRKISFEEIARATTANTRRLFGI